MHSCAQRNSIVHLVLAALGAVAVEAQSLVGGDLVEASVSSSAKGNTIIESQLIMRGNSDSVSDLCVSGEGKLREDVSCLRAG